MLRLGVRWSGGNICRDRAAALVGAGEDVWIQMTYGLRMAAACTMTVMRRGCGSGGGGESTDKSIKSVCMDSAVLLYHHSPSPGFLSLPDELNYLLSLLTPDDCSFPLAHIIYTIRVMFRRMSPKSLVS